MSAKRSRLVRSASSQKVRMAKLALQEMPKLRQIDLMVEAGSLTEEQAKRAKKKLAEVAG